MNPHSDNTLDELISLAEACRCFPRRRAGKKPHIATLYRWSVSGVRGVRLRTVQVGATRCTTRSSIDQFIADLTANRDGGPIARPVSPTAARAQRDQIERELEQEGL